MDHDVTQVPKQAMIHADDRWIRLNIAWRHRYQQARRILETFVPKLRRLSLLLPHIFDETTEVGRKNREEVFKYLDDGDNERLKIFVDTYEEELAQAHREQYRRKQAEALKHERHAL